MAKVTEVQNNHSESNGSSDVTSFVPWNNPDNVITYETSATILNSFVCYFNPIIFFIGVPANVLNCVVFFRQGSFFLLSVISCIPTNTITLFSLSLLSFSYLSYCAFLSFLL